MAASEHALVDWVIYQIIKECEGAFEYTLFL